MLKVRCQANATLDVKGRVALPAPVRRALREAELSSLVLTFHRDCLWCWAPEDFEAIEAHLEECDPFDEDVMDFVHAVLAPAQDVEIDKQGRIRIPPRLRELADLGKDVVIHSLLNRIEIWARDGWESRFRQSLERRSRTSGMPQRRG